MAIEFLGTVNSIILLFVYAVSYSSKELYFLSIGASTPSNFAAAGIVVPCTITETKTTKNTTLNISCE